LILTGGRIETIDPRRPRAEAVAVVDGRIAAVGSRAEAHAAAGPGAETVDLAGGLLLPGFQDAHVHPLLAGAYLLQCDVRPAGGDARGYVEIVRRYAAEHPEREWIAGAGWILPAFPGGIPHRTALDAAVADRPVLLRSQDEHQAWLNTRALELAGITTATPDPPGGRIERDPDGTPSGALHESAIRLASDLLPPLGQADWTQALLLAQAQLHSLGVTAVYDPWVHANFQQAYLDLAARGELTLRCALALAWDPERGDEQLAELVDRRADGAAARVDPVAAKLFADGVMGSFTAVLLEPYAQGGTGLRMYEPELLRHIVGLLDREGFQVHVHAIGDGAVRESLDAFEGASRDARHQICHLQLVHEDDLPRFAELGVVANAQPYWARNDPYLRELHAPSVGPERAGRMYPIGSLRRAGAQLAFGSDWPVSTANPLEEIEVAVTRVGPDDRTTEPLVPHEAIPLESALAAFTRGAAYAARREQETGTIEVGKRADLVALDRDLFAAGPAGDARVVLTLVDGEAVFDGR
jgi:predicted amidohydrolase YtcJ